MPENQRPPPRSLKAPDMDDRRLAELAGELILRRPPGLGGTRLGVVDGPSGSGKSTFARLWASMLQGQTRIEQSGASVLLFSSDLLATWADPFGWFERFDAAVFTPLSQGRPGRIQLTDWSAGGPVPGGWMEIPVVDVLILEGVSSGRAELGDRVGVSVWLREGDREKRLERAVARDGESSRTNLTAWQDAEDAFFEKDRPWNRADFLVSPSSEPGRPSAEATPPPSPAGARTGHACGCDRGQVVRLARPDPRDDARSRPGGHPADAPDRA